MWQRLLSQAPLHMSTGPQGACGVSQTTSSLEASNQGEQSTELEKHLEKEMERLEEGLKGRSRDRAEKQGREVTGKWR